MLWEKYPTLRPLRPPILDIFLLLRVGSRHPHTHKSAPYLRSISYLNWRVWTLYLIVANLSDQNQNFFFNKFKPIPKLVDNFLLPQKMLWNRHAEICLSGWSMRWFRDHQDRSVAVVLYGQINLSSCGHRFTGVTSNEQQQSVTKKCTSTRYSSSR